MPEPPLSLFENAALFLDFDGTLVDLAEAPDAIEVSGGLHSLLSRLRRRLHDRVAILSGRALGDLALYVGDPDIALAGSHGLELRLPRQRPAPLVPTPGLTEACDAVVRFTAAVPGLLVEEKPASVALHYRKAPEREAEVLAFADALAARTGLQVQRGKMVAELRPAGANKGDALRALMAEPVFAGARPLFVGDDLTDEDAFAAAAAMGGAGILVGAARETAARWRLADVAAVAEWLERGAGGE